MHGEDCLVLERCRHRSLNLQVTAFSSGAHLTAPACVGQPTVNLLSHLPACDHSYTALSPVYHPQWIHSHVPGRRLQVSLCQMSVACWTGPSPNVHHLSSSLQALVPSCHLSPSTNADTSLKPEVSAAARKKPEASGRQVKF